MAGFLGISLPRAVALGVIRDDQRLLADIVSQAGAVHLIALLDDNVALLDALDVDL